jgi:hypothetical protein
MQAERGERGVSWWGAWCRLLLLQEEQG